MREKTQTKSILGKNIKKYRKEKRITQALLADKLGISTKHLSEIETGTVFASSALLDKISEVLNEPIASLLSDIEFNSNYIKELDSIIDDEMLKATVMIKKRIREL